MGKSKFLAIIVLVLLLNIGFAWADYAYTTRWKDSNGNPVSSVRAINNICNDGNCDNPLSEIFDQTVSGNTIAVNYPTPSPANGYATYWMTQCHIIKESPFKPAGSGSSTQDLQFNKKSNY